MRDSKHVAGPMWTSAVVSAAREHAAAATMGSVDDPMAGDLVGARLRALRGRSL